MGINKRILWAEGKRGKKGYLVGGDQKSNYMFRGGDGIKEYFM
jgi:hypothetical protein